MDAQKPIEFNATAGDYFIMSLITSLVSVVPFFGWAYALNYVAQWHAERMRINGRPIVYRATYVESLKFITVSMLLLFVTFGIYTFWFGPKLYHYVAEHMHYTEGGTVGSPVAEAPMPSQPTSPHSPVPPVS